MKRLHVMITPTLAICLLAPTLLAQEKKGATLERWGQVLDPDGDCKVRMDGGRVTIEVPPKLHDLSAEMGTVNAPRVLREVEGDFIAEVTVAGAVTPGGRPTRPRSLPFHGAGLLLWQDEKNFIRLERAAILRDGRPMPYANFEQRKGGALADGGPKALEDKPLHLRLERRGSRVIGSVSFDGVRWTALKELTADLPKAVKVGVAALNSAGTPFRAELEGYELFVRADPGRPGP